MRVCGLAVVLVVAAAAGCAGAASAAEPAPLTAEAAQRAAAGGDHGKAEVSANPLWAMSLREMSATQNRPIFSPSRRPPAPPTLLAAPPPPPKPVAVPREADHPPLALVGTIVSDNLKIGIFREETTKETTRLKTGEDYRGWLLRSVSAREVEFAGPDRNAVLVLPPPEAGATPAPLSAGPATPADSEPPPRQRKR